QPQSRKNPAWQMRCRAVAVLLRSVFLMRTFTQRTKGQGLGRKLYDLDPIGLGPLVRPDGVMMPPGSSDWTRSFHRLTAKWSALNLSAQFAVAALVVLVCGMAVFGMWVSNRIENGVLQSTASGVSLYINSLVEPHVRELNKSARLKPDSESALDALLRDTPLGRKVVGIKVWSSDGTIIYSSKKDMIGRKFPLSDRLRAAFGGRISSEFKEISNDNNEFRRDMGAPLLEIYSPIIATS